MITFESLLKRTLIVAAVGTLGAQQPPQFKANVKMKDGSDGSTASGTVYFGGAKVRTELSKGGQDIVVLADPMAKSQYVLMPTQNVYMQMAIGQGPVNIPITGSSDPTNPCSAASGNTDCVKGPTEAVNGHNAVRWDYTSAEGVRTRAWVSTTLRFPVKTEDDNGSSMEFSNIAPGPQAASLFSIPPGYKKMDVGAMGAVGGGMARGGGGGGGGRSNPSDPIASAMANMSPQARAAMAAARRGEAPKGVAPVTGSAWERGNGFTVSVTVMATETKGKAIDDGGLMRYSIEWKNTLPLNFGSPAAGVVGSSGPMWSLLAGSADVGNPSANRVPVTLSVITEIKNDVRWTSDCQAHGETWAEDPGMYQDRMSTTTQRSLPVTDAGITLRAQGNLALSADLKTYDLVAGVVHTPEVEEVTKRHTETTGCRDKQLHKKDEINKHSADYAFTLELKGEPLPATVSTISGSRKMPVTIDGRKLDATVSWTITPIR
jgi:hypothetical protein